MIILFLAIGSCNTVQEEKKESTANKIPIPQPMDGTKFFDYNSIEYFKIEISGSEVEDIYKNETKSEIDLLKEGVILGHIPSSISDSDFIYKLTTIGYKKFKIDRSRFGEFDKLFIQKSATNKILTKCKGDVYRDILIFKKDNKVIGTAKICFSCLRNQIRGSRANTFDFGQNGDYTKLAQLLKQ